jgi:hypothetical protein
MDIDFQEGSGSLRAGQRPALPSRGDIPTDTAGTSVVH